MGFGQSTPEIAAYCSFKKNDFKKQIEVIKDAHTVMQYYASVLLVTPTPTQLPLYKNYTPLSESVFNSRRQEQIEAINQADQKLNSYYDVYQMLKGLERDFESTIQEADRKAILTKVMNVTYSVMVTLVDELRVSCEVQQVEQ